MSIRVDLEQWILEALKRLGGSGKIVQIAEDIWKHRESDIGKYPKGLFTWQYDMRWAGQSLQDQGKLRKSKGTWSAASGSK